MKQLLLSLTASLLYIPYCYGQVTVSSHTGGYSELYTCHHSIAGVIGDNICELFSGSRTTEIGNPHFKLDVRLYNSKNLEYNKTIYIDLRLKSGDARWKSPHFNNLYILDSILIILSSRYEKDDTVAYYGRIYDFNFYTKSEAVLLAKGKDLKLNSTHHRLSKDKKTFSFSTSGANKNKSLNVYLVSSDLKVLLETNEIENTNKTNDVFEHHSVEILGDNSLATIWFDKNDSLGTYSLKIKDVNGNNDETLSIGNDNILMNLSVITDYTDSTIKISTVYYNADDKYLKGIYSATINRNTLKIAFENYSNFNRDNLNKASKNKNASYSSKIGIRNVYKAQNGDIILTGDAVLQTYHSSSSHVMYGKAGYTINGTPHKFLDQPAYTSSKYENIMIVRLDSTGTIRMHELFRRLNTSESVELYQDLKEPVILFSDNAENYDIGNTPFLPKVSGYDLVGKKSAGVYSLVSLDSASNPQMFFNGKENKKYVLRSRVSNVINENEVVFICRKRNFHYMLVKVTFDWDE